MNSASSRLRRLFKVMYMQDDHPAIETLLVSSSHNSARPRDRPRRVQRLIAPPISHKLRRVERLRGLFMFVILRDSFECSVRLGRFIVNKGRPKCLA